MSEKPSISELLVQKQTALQADVESLVRSNRRACRLRCCMSASKLCFTVGFLALIIYILYALYLYLFSSSAFLPQVFTAVSSFVSCVTSPIECMSVRRRVNETYYAPVRDPDPTLVQFLEEYEKCKEIKFGGGSSLWSDRFVLEACGCDVTHEAFKDIKNCTFSGNFTVIAKHCIGLDVPDCKKHIEAKPQYAALPRAAPIIVDNGWRCEPNWMNYFAYYFLRTVSFTSLGTHPKKVEEKCLARYAQG